MDTEIGCFIKPEVGHAETKVQSRAQDRGGQACQGAWGVCGARSTKRPFSRSQRRTHSWCPSVLAVLVHWLKMDAQKTYVLWLNRNTEEQAFSSRGTRARQVAAHLSAEVRAVRANTNPPMRTTRS